MKPVVALLYTVVIMKGGAAISCSLFSSFLPPVLQMTPEYDDKKTKKMQTILEITYKWTKEKLMEFSEENFSNKFMD